MVKIITLVGDDNQIYQALAIEGEPVRTLIDSRAGAMSFTPLKDERWADTRPPPGE